MGRALFIPVSIAGGFAGGIVGKKAFEAVWALIDDQEPPAPEHRDIDLRKMTAALAVQGIVFTVTRGWVEHAMRVGFARATGQWPGEEAPEEK